MAPRLIRLPLLLTLVAGLTFSITALPTRAQTTAPLDASAFELHEMGRIEGGVNYLAANDSILAVGTNSAIVFYDLDDPQNPRLLSVVPLPDMVASIVVQGDYVYVSWGSCENLPIGWCKGGFDVYDLALPTAPVRLSRINNPEHLWNNLLVIGDTAYVYGSSMEAVIDLSDPTTPIVRERRSNGFYEAVAVADRVDRNGQRLFYNVLGSTLNIIDLTTQQTLSSLPLSTPAWAQALLPMRVPDGREMLYIVDYKQGVRVIDVTDPTNLIEHPTVAWANLGFIVAGAPGTQTLYASGENTVITLDLTDPAAPIISNANNELGPGSLTRSGNVLIGSRIRSISSRIEHSIVLADVQNSLLPEPAGEIPMITNASIPGYSQDHLLMSDQDRQMFVVDIQRPAAPTRHHLNLQLNGLPKSVFAVDDDLAVIAVQNDGWQVFDLANPLQPQLVSRIASPDTLFPMGAALTTEQGQRVAYLLKFCQPWITPCKASPELRIVNLDDPASPRVVNIVPMPPLGDVGDFVVHNGYAYLIHSLPGPGPENVGYGQLQIVDVRNPTAPQVLGSIAFSGPPHRMAASGDRVYVAAVMGGLHTFDVSDPTTPQLLSTFRRYPRQQTQAVAVDGPIVYFTTLYASELFTLDMRDPTQPRLVDERIIPGGSAALTIVGDQLIASGAGMTIYRRGPMPPGAVVDLRGAPVTDVSVMMTGGARSSLAAAAPSRATDVNGRFSVQGAATGTQLTPSFGAAAFWPATRTIAQQPDTLRFTMLPPPVTAEISAEAAMTLTLTDTQGLPTTLTAPAGSLSGASAVTLSGAAPTQTDGLQLAGQAFELRLAGADAQFAAPSTVSVSYSRGDVRLISDRTQLALYRQTGSGWTLAETGCADAAAQQHDAAARTITTAICAPGVYALLGPTERIYLPALAR